MTNGGDRMMQDALDDAIEATAHRSTTPGLCGEHDGIRQGVHALCLCRQAELANPKTAISVKECSFGKFKVKGYDAADLTKILAAIIVIVLLASDKMARWGVKADVKETANAAEVVNEKQLAAMRSIAQSLIDETLEKMREKHQ